MKAVVLAFALLFSVGCGKKTDTAIPSAPENPAAAAPTAPSAPATDAPPAEADMSATLARLTQTVRRFAAEHRRAPASLNELVQAGYLPEMPGAPPGKKFVI